MNDKKLVAVFGAIAVFILLLIAIFGLAVGYYFITQKNAVETATASPTPASQPANAQTSNVQTSPTPSVYEIPLFSEVLKTGESSSNSSAETPVLVIIGRLFISVILSAILAFRPRRNIPLFQRNLYVAQTQILLAVVAAALMMIVGDNAARAFAIFAAVSFVRFRTNIKDPKEITVLVISLALGLSAGVGRWDLGIVLCLFALVLLWALEYKESEQVFRSMELTVKTRNPEQTQNLLKSIFAHNKLEAEVRQIDPPDKKDSPGSIMYYLSIPLNLSTDVLSEQIIASDTGNIAGIVWKNQKNATNIFQ